MSSGNTSSTPTSPSQAEIINFTANTAIPISLWEPEIIDLTGDDPDKLPNDDSTSATILEPNSDRVMLYTEPVSYGEDEASVKSEPWSPAEVDFDSTMGYFAPDYELNEDNMADDDNMFDESTMSETASLIELTSSEYASALGSFGPAPPENHPSMGPESEPCSPTEVDVDFAMGCFGPDPELDDDESVFGREFRPDLEYDSVLGYCGPDRKMMRRAKSCLKQEGGIIDLTADLKQE